MGGYNLTFGADGQSAGEAHPLYGLTGENHPSWGRRNTIETLKKMSASHRGLAHSQETKQKISEAKKEKEIRSLVSNMKTRLQNTMESAK